jgi:hypothetical protein
MSKEEVPREAKNGDGGSIQKGRMFLLRNDLQDYQSLTMHQTHQFQSILTGLAGIGILLVFLVTLMLAIIHNLVIALVA